MLSQQKQCIKHNMNYFVAIFTIKYLQVMQSQQLNKVEEIEDLSHKLFITNLDGRIPEQDLHDQLSALFEKHGRVTKLSVRRNKGGRYSFAFLEFSQPKEAANAIKNLDQYDFHGKAMKVRPDRPTNGCFHCKREGHQARQCPYKDDKGGSQKISNRRNKYYDRRDSKRRSRSRENYRQQYNRRDRHDNDRYKRRKSYSYSESRSMSRSSSSSKGHYRPEVRSKVRSFSRSQQRRSRSYSRESSEHHRQSRKRNQGGRNYSRNYERRSRQNRSRSREYEGRRDKHKKYRERSYS